MKIRQEINIVDTLKTVNTVATALPEIANVSFGSGITTGSITWYFEVEANSNSTPSSGFFIRLRRFGTTTDDALIDLTTLPTGSNNFGLVRVSFTPVSGTNYFLQCDWPSPVASTYSISAARIIAMQSETPTIGFMFEQIEIGSGTITSTTGAPLPTPKYWKYVAATYDGVISTSFSATTITTSSKTASTIKLQSSANLSTWTDVTGTSISLTNTAATLSGLMAFTPTDGNYYRVAGQGIETKTGLIVYNSKITIYITPPVDQSQTASSANQQNIYGSGGTNEAVGQAWTTGSAYTLWGIQILTGWSGTPTDNLVVSVYSGSPGGTLLTQTTIPNASVPFNNYAYINLNGITLTGSTTYYVTVGRTGARDISNYFWLKTASTTTSPSPYVQNSGTWSVSGNTWYFQIFKQWIKGEAQYLLGNRTLANVTTLQKMYNHWDPADWDKGSGTLTCKHQVDSGGTSAVVEIDTSGGTQIANSPVTANAVTVIGASAMTMPTAQDLDVKMTTATADVYGSRILALFSWAAPVAARRIFVTGG